MPGIMYGGEQFPPFPARGEWYFPNRPLPEWWLELPDKPTKLTFTLKQRLFGPMRSHTDKRLGLIGRLLYGWFFTDDPYFVRIDEELKRKGL